ncbi:MAG: Gfo/Idh/MocA family oxidoreductase [Planctomycetes bacterium]|nr:Gfo/Idh/MocA family oxidoreductase [Planctomycetota bacterium]MBL7041610.1 Gfo/Idh/MocA family oxidoreductase [Pirellulaceae bacterium]
MQDGKLGVAIHGAGWVASAHVLSWKKNPHVQVVSVGDINLERAQQFADNNGLSCAVRDNFDEVLADECVDIVDVSGPSHVHAEQGIAAAEAGKHVLVEKPIALTMEENRALRDAVAKSGVKSITSFVSRFNQEVVTLRSMLQSKAIGELFYAEVDYWHGIKPTHHAWNLHSKKKTGGSTMLLGGCHAIDALRWLVDDEVEELTAYSNNPKGFFEYDANVVAVMKFRGGVIAKASALFDCEMPYSFNIDLAGTEGTLRDNRVWSKKLFPGQTSWSTFPTIMMDSADVMHHSFDEEINYFVECIREDRQPHCNIIDGYRSHELCMAIDRSIEVGGPVKLPLEP